MLGFIQGDEDIEVEERSQLITLERIKDYSYMYKYYSCMYKIFTTKVLKCNHWKMEEIVHVALVKKNVREAGLWNISRIRDVQGKLLEPGKGLQKVSISLLRTGLGVSALCNFKIVIS